MASAQCKTILTPEITTISKFECIGNSLPALNRNFENLQTGICQVDSNLSETNLQLTNVQNVVDGLASQQFAKAWVNFSGRRREDPENPTTGRTDFTNANRFVRSRFNITNIVRNDIGDYTAFFQTPLPENYVTTGFVSMAPTTTTTFVFTDFCIVTFSPQQNPDSNKIRLRTVNLQGVARDPEFITFTIFGSEDVVL